MQTAERRLTDAEKREFLNAKAQRHTGPHAMKGKAINWPYCIHCGLVALKNDVTRKALAKPCVWED